MSQHKHLYNTARWLRMREYQLTLEPLCRMCEMDGRITVATVVDHVEPHRGDEQLFFYGRLQSLCKLHHDSTKQSEERTGRMIGGSINGEPFDLNHHWNK